MIRANDLRTLIIRPTLAATGLWTQAAENLLLGTAAQESHMGEYLKQIKGPALGIYQMEPNTHDSLQDNYLFYRDDLREMGDHYCGDLEGHDALVGNLFYATFMARIKYYQNPEPLPDAEDIPGLAHYWKRVYNTYHGAGTEAEFIRNYKRFTL